MDNQETLNGYSYGFDDGYDGSDKSNPYFSYYIKEFEPWKAYEKGYREGLKERAANAEPTT